MKTLKMKVVVAISVTAGLAAGIPAAVQAVSSLTATGIAAPITSSLQKNSVAQLSAYFSTLGETLTMTCTKSATTFVLSTDETGLGPFPLKKPPTFTNCTDNVGGTDTVKGTGTWTTTYNNAGTDGISGNSISITIPSNGQTITSTAFPNCTLTISPGAATTVTGAYNNAGLLTFTNQSIPYSAAGAGCPGGPTSGTGTFSTVLGSGQTGTPGYLVSPAIYGVAS